MSESLSLITTINAAIHVQMVTSLSGLLELLRTSFGYSVITPEITVAFNAELEGEEELLQEMVSAALLPFKDSINKFAWRHRRKVKTAELEFLNDLELLGIKFSQFSEENKNTKLTLIRYLHQILLLSLTLDKAGYPSEQMQALSVYFKSVETAGPDFLEPELEQQVEGALTRTAGGGGPGGRPSIDGLITGLFGGSPEIGNLLKEIVGDLETALENPMELFTSVVTGNLENSGVGDLLKSMTAKVSSKIATGAINTASFQEALEKVAQPNEEMQATMDGLGISSNEFKSFKKATEDLRDYVKKK